ncbi:MAG: exosortase K [Lachnospiraceae bacterium]|nr:exosortase K [Lachnospiraceae bacterium]
MGKNIMYDRIYQNRILLMAATVITLVMCYFCRTSDSDALTWILTPTAWWVSILGGIPFEYLPHQGYVNHLWQFVIAPSCAGCRFMLITFLMLVFSFGKNESARGPKKQWAWLGFSLVFAYVSTILVNGIRIVASIYLPVVLERKQLMVGWLTPDRLHTLIGTITYFISLCVIYLLALSIHQRIFERIQREGGKAVEALSVEVSARTMQHRNLTVPAFWYLLVVLALPFVKRMYHHDLAGFGTYAAVIGGVCGSVCVLFMLIGNMRRRRKAIKGC